MSSNLKWTVMSFVKFFLILALYISVAGCNNMPLNEDLILDRFLSNRDNFHKLALMLDADNNIGRIDTESTVPSSLKDLHITESRLQIYRRLMSVTGTSVIMRIGDEIRFYSKKNSLKFREIGFSYKITSPANITTTSFSAYNCNGAMDMTYKELERGWYVFGICKGEE